MGLPLWNRVSVDMRLVCVWCSKDGVVFVVSPDASKQYPLLTDNGQFVTAKVTTSSLALTMQHFHSTALPLYRAASGLS